MKAADEAAHDAASEDDGQDPTQAAPIVEEHPTEVMAVEDTGASGSEPPTEEQPVERRYTAPSGMDSSTTRFIETSPDPATEVFSAPAHPMAGKLVAPQTIPPRGETSKLPGRRRSWGWVVALILVIAALAAVAILGTLLLTRD
ncbi:MAG: DUF4878 domain-containing protein, partial [Mycobacterium sp.]